MAKAAGSEQATMYAPAASDTAGNVKLTPLVKVSPCSGSVVVPMFWSSTNSKSSLPSTLV